MAMDLQRIAGEARRLGMGPLSLRLLDAWLALSEDSALPQPGAFDPAAMGEALRCCGLFEVEIGRAVVCRNAGALLRLLFGPNICGEDWLAATPAPHRRQRLIRYSAVAQGAVGLGRRMAARPALHTPLQIEEIMLPFARPAEGCVQVLVHSDWRPEGDEWFGADPSPALVLASEFQLIALD